MNRLQKEVNSRSILTDKERNLIRLIRETAFGELRIIIQDKQPIRVEELKNSIKL